MPVVRKHIKDVHMQVARKGVPLVFVLLALFSCSSNNDTSFSVSPREGGKTSFDLEFPNRKQWDWQKSFDIETQFFNLHVDSFSFGSVTQAYGGSLRRIGEEFFIARADGTFVLVDPETGRFKEDFIPRLNLGSNSISDSKNLKQQETLPRVHDAILVKNKIYVSHDFYDQPSDCIFFAVSSIDGSLGSWTRIFQSEPFCGPIYTLGSGGALAANDEGFLYFSIGTFGREDESQIRSSPWGKIYELELSSLKFRQFSIGHRNPKGLVFVGKTLYSSEMGPRGGDELNILEASLNYGWPIESKGTAYETFDRNTTLGANSKSNMSPPIFSWIPSIAPTQMIEIQKFDASWNSQLLMGSLKAESLFVIDIENNHVLSVEQIFLGSRIRSLLEFKTNIYLWTDDNTILMLSKT